VRRRLATVLLLDIVGSTAIASELGDARWRAVLARFDRGGESGPPIGLTGDAIQGTVAKGHIWLAELDVVDRVSIATGRRQTITLPKGMEATGIALDPVTNAVWVAASTPVPQR
jgi:hypothetical protein